MVVNYVSLYNSMYILYVNSYPNRLFLILGDQLLSTLLPGLVGLSSLLVLRLLSTLHGGVVSTRGAVGLYPGWFFTYWLAKERKIGRDRHQVDVRMNGHTFNREEFSEGDVSQEMDLFIRI